MCVRIQLRHVFITTYHLRLQGKSPEFSPDSNYWRLQIFTKKCLIIVNMTNFGFRWVAAMGLEWDLICGYKMIDWMGKVTAWKFSETILKCGSLWFRHSINHKEKPVGRTSLKRALMNRILLLVGFELLEEVRVKAYPCVEIQGWRGLWRGRSWKCRFLFWSVTLRWWMKLQELCKLQKTEHEKKRPV